MMLWLLFALVLGFVFLGFVGSRSVADGTESTTRSRTMESEDAIDALKRRYVNGEIDIEEFERRAKRLYETEAASRREPTTIGTQSAEPTRTTTPPGNSSVDRSARPPNGRGGCRR